MSLSSEALLHMHPGRKRSAEVKRDGPGSCSGTRKQRSRGERPEDVRAIAKAYRIKDGANPEKALHEDYGSTIGRLRLERTISDEQFYAAQRYATCVIQNARLFGIPSPHPRALDLLMASKGFSCEGEIPEEVANEIKQRFRDCRRELLDCGRDLLVGSAINQVVYGVAVEDWRMGQLTPADIQNLRCGLNVLARLMKDWGKPSCA